jgi:26S proteasome regulatory subunit T1
VIALLGSIKNSMYKKQALDLQESVSSLQKEIDDIVTDELEAMGWLIPPDYDPADELFSFMRSIPLVLAQVTGKYKIEDDRFHKFVIKYGEDSLQMVVRIAPQSRIRASSIEEGTRVGIIGDLIWQILPPSKDIFLHLVEVVDNPEVSFDMIGGYKDQLKSLKEVFVPSKSLLESAISLGVQMPKGCLLYGPPGTALIMCTYFFQFHCIVPRINYSLNATKT